MIGSKSDRTKKILADNLKNLMCNQKFERISIESICLGAHVTRRNFYNHYRDKYDLLNWIYDQDFCFDFCEHPDWSIADYFPLFCQILYDNKAFYLKAYQLSGQNGFREHSYHWLYPLLHRDFKNCFHSDKREKSILQFTSNLTFDAIIDWLKSEPCVPPNEFSKTYMEDLCQFYKKSAALFDRTLNS